MKNAGYIFAPILALLCAGKIHFNFTISVQGYLVETCPDCDQFKFITIASGLNQPTGIEWAPDGRIFVALKAGIILVIDTDGNLQNEPWIDFSPNVHNAAGKEMNF